MRRRTAVTVAILAVASGVGWAAPGGVAGAAAHARPPARATTAPVAIEPMSAAAPHASVRLPGTEAGVHPGPLLDGGGPVQTSPQVYVDFWGWTAPSADPHGERSYLTRFLSSVGGSNWAKVVTQYGGSAAVSYDGSWDDTSSTPPADVTGTQIAAEADKAIAHWGLTSLDDQVVVALPDGVDMSSSPSACAYHSFQKAVTFTALPYLAAPYPPSSGGDGKCGLASVNGAAAGQDDSVSLMEGHELAETITDPHLNAWKSAPGAGGEIGDKCEYYNESDLVTTQGTFAVQPLWSNDADWCSLGLDQGTKSWGPEIPATGQFTPDAPAIATAGGAVYEASRSDTGDQVYVTEDPGSGWLPSVLVPGASTASSPAVAVFGGSIYVAWTDSAAPGEVLESSTTGLGQTWTAPTIVGATTQTSSASPAICSSGTSLYVAFRSASSTGVFVTQLSLFGWSAATPVPGAATEFAPALACGAGANTATVVWTGLTGHPAYATVDGSAISAVSSFPGVTTATSPAATTFAGVANSGATQSTVIAWKVPTSQSIQYVVDQGTSWSGRVTVPLLLGTDLGPSLAAGVTWGSEAAHATLYLGVTAATGDGVDLVASNTP